MKSSLEVTPKAALDLIQKGALLVDIREPREIAEKSFDLPDVIPIPLGEFKTRFQEIPANRQVIMACHSGGRSIMATRFLASKGYGKVMNMQNGIAGWEKEGLPIRKKTKQTAGAKLLQMFGKKS
ncbi:MAG: rhodanese-like domain-containing protein [Chlorobium sp.]